MQPIQQQFTGTGIAAAIVPDIYQNPFRMSVGVQLLTGGLSTAIVSIEHTYDWPVVMARASWAIEAICKCSQIASIAQDARAITTGQS